MVDMHFNSVGKHYRTFGTWCRNRTWTRAGFTPGSALGKGPTMYFSEVKNKKCFSLETHSTRFAVIIYVSVVGAT